MAGHGGQQSPQGQQTPHHRKLDRSLSEPKGQKNGQGGQNSNSSRYKTELCRPFEESGVCKYGDKCQFAHGYQELRTLTRHPKYKTELCCTFHTTGLCPYGSRCHFIHNPDENRAKIMPSMAMLGQPQTQPAMNGHGVHNCKPLHGSLSSPAIGMAPSHAPVSHQIPHPSSLRSLSLGSSIGSGSSGELSPSSSPGMFEDPFSPNVYATPSATRSLANNPLFSDFGSDLEMSTLAAAFSAAESHAASHGLLKSAGSAPATPPYASSLALLSSSGPWSSPNSEITHTTRRSRRFNRAPLVGSCSTRRRRVVP
ncbi:hypothetical protein BIW11_04448 [Tropilaelaps mercedesae]|uniref:C3H1-type domain-containing protein n=1 Tax=Tropilaelaps mercedesae TaxID=418985 RepID=A0A1V9X702_9ACAR|nr:hypothetical protein BIW11_04448 [Tropilaelaps mercedesae]